MNDRTVALLELLSERIAVLDGAMGTQIQARGLSARDYGGEPFEGCNEALVLSRPDVVRSVHDAYLAAGADIVETDTFGGTPLVLGEYGLADRAFEINRRAAQIAREACAEASTPARPRFAAGSMGPTTRSISLAGGLTFTQLADHYRVQALGLLEGGADLLFLETVQDALNAKAGLAGIRKAVEESGREVPLVVSATVEPSGTLLAGQTIEAFYASVMHAPLLAVGLNCATGPDLMGSHLRSLSGMARTRTVCFPNAGMPDEGGRYGLSPESLARAMRRFAQNGWINVAGGCCGTGPDHVRALAQALEGVAPRRVPDHHRVFLSGIDFLELEEDNRPVLAGERANALGSRAFKRRIAEGRFEEAVEIARDQVRAGAQVVDVCLQDPERDETSDLTAFLERAGKVVRAPLMIDTTDPRAAEAALPLCPGRCLLNSANLEDGGGRLARMAELARTFGAALVVQTIDEDPEEGMARTAERKMAVARRAFALLTEGHGLRPEDIFFDPLVFPCGTGSPRFRGAAAETLAALRSIKAEFPDSRTLLGISNVSFGLPAAAREAVNAVFLYHATRAGLDVAIVNTEKIPRFPSIPEAERSLCEDLLFDRGPDPLGALLTRFKTRPAGPDGTPEPAVGPEEALLRCVTEGSRRGLVEALDALLAAGAPPLDIVNGPLLRGMDEVGRRFARNELIVAEVLRSAEVMRAAVSHLERHIDGAAPSRGTVVLATVRGDVHDIGKNLVDMILSNNGYRVVNLGTKVTPEKIIAACRQHEPHALGLSGLLVRSAHEMAATAREVTEAGLDPILLVGGAALTERFTDRTIAPAYGGLTAYAATAMAGLELLNRLLSPEEGAAAREELRREREARLARSAEPLKDEAASPSGKAVPPVEALPPPDRGMHLLEALDPSALWPYVNLQMLYGRHLGLQGPAARLLEAGDPRALQLREVVQEILDSGWLRPKGLYRFFGAESRGDSLFLDTGDGARTELPFPRQRSGDRLCIADFVRPASLGGGDSVALLVATAGEGVRERASSLRAQGRLLISHALQAVALELAEAAAEWIHRRIREAWGLPDPEDLSMADRLRGRYRGKRFSFGYPACPDLEGQDLLFRLLGPERIGVRLTTDRMMDPEASVSAVVVHHPEARYFSV
ncbi:MAG: methionine synthase [Acidobacteriota bacterium]